MKYRCRILSLTIPNGSFTLSIPVVTHLILKCNSGWESALRMQLIRKCDLPFTAASITYRGSTIAISQVLVDTGSASTVISADLVDSSGIFPLPADRLSTIRGVGGSEVVFRRRVDCLQVGEKGLVNFDLEVGGMDYGFAINGILGMDFLTEAKAIINLQAMSRTFNG